MNRKSTTPGRPVGANPPHGRARVRSIAGGKSATALAALAIPEPKSIGELAGRMRLDYQVRLAESVLAANIQAAEVTVRVDGNEPTDGPGPSDQRGQLLADHLQQLWQATLPAMLGAIAEGRVAFEKVWDYAPGANVSFIRKLEPLPFAQTDMRTAAGGAFDGVDLNYGSRDPLTIPSENAWWLALDPTAIEPHGRSRFLGAPYAVWKERREAIRLRGILRTKLIVSGGVAHIPMTETLENGQEIDNAAEMAKAHDARIAGSLLLLSNERDKAGNYLYDYAEQPSTLDLSPLDCSIDGMDQEQLQAFGIPPKTVLEGGSVGSFAMVSQQMLTLYAVVEDILNQFETSFQKYVIDKVVEASYAAATSPRIRIGHTPLVTRGSK